MKPRTILFIATLSTLIFTGCQNNDLSSENQSLKQKITDMEQQITELEQQITDMEQQVDKTADTASNTSNMTSSQTTISENTAAIDNNTTTYTMKELTAMVDEFVVSVGSATPDINNSGNLDQFFSLKREADQIDHALENHENSLEDQYRAGTLSKEEYRVLDKEVELLEENLDSAFDRLEIAFSIED